MLALARLFAKQNRRKAAKVQFLHTPPFHILRAR